MKLTKFKSTLCALWRSLTLTGLVCLLAFVVAMPPTFAEASPAEALFDLHCAGCHANGGNIIRRGKTLKKRAMARHGYEDAESIAQIVRQGKGAMPAFADRLSEEEVNAITRYVHTQSESGW